MKSTRYFTYIFVSVWKVMVFFTSMLLIELLTVGKMDNIFLFFQPGFGDHKVNLTEIISNKFAQLDIPGAGRLTETETISSWPNTAIYLCVIQSFAAFLCFGLGKFACKICIQVCYEKMNQCSRWSSCPFILLTLAFLFSNPGFQLRFPSKLDHSSYNFSLDCLLRLADWQSVHVFWHYSTLFVLGLSQRRFPYRSHHQSIRLGLAPLAPVTDLDHIAHLDSEMRTFGSHREIVRQSLLLLASNRPVDGYEPATWRWKRCQNGRHWTGTRRSCRYGHDSILRNDIYWHGIVNSHTQNHQGLR